MFLTSMAQTTVNSHRYCFRNFRLYSCIIKNHGVFYAIPAGLKYDIELSKVA